MFHRLELFKRYLAENGVAATNHRSLKLKSRLKKHFGAQLVFQQPMNRNKPELVYFSGVKKGDIVESIVTNSVFSGESERHCDVPDDSLRVHETPSYQIYHAAKQLRSILLEMKPSMPWPPSVGDLDDGTTIVPNLLYNMFVWMLSSKDDYSGLSTNLYL